MANDTQGQETRGQGAGAAGSERELKFLADAQTLKQVLAEPAFGAGDGSPKWKALRTVYFDTDDGDLSRARVALRVRQSDDGWVMGLKRAASGGGAFEREETEVSIFSGEPDLSLFDKALAREVTDVTGGKPLAPKFGSDIRRTVRTVEVGGAAVEIAFDDGFLFAGERRAPIVEIEFELKSGPPSALFDLGLGLVEKFPVRLGLQSKAERARALLAPDETPEPVHAEDPALSPGVALDDAIAAIVRTCLGQFLGNLPALEGGDKVEAVHQMRVGMRRLRSAMDLFGKAFPTAELDALRAEGRRIGTALGVARDWDVFVGRLSDGPLSRFATEPGFDPVASAARGKADAAHSEVTRLVDDKTVARFALRVERLVAARAWREGCGGDTLAALGEPVESFAARSLGKLDRKMRKRGRGFKSLDQKARHRLRIGVKHLRYATEFFGGLFDAKEAEELREDGLPTFRTRSATSTTR